MQISCVHGTIIKGKGDPMIKRYLEFVGEDAGRGIASSAKFWEITIDGSALTIRFGKIGATGQTTHKEFASPQEADAEATKLIASKVKKGYVESSVS
jgi:predicted DNA-binding WGR domain protein